MYKLPQKTIFNQNNRSDKLGDLWSSYNLDPISNFGSLKVHPRMILNLSEADDADFDAPPCAFRFFNSVSNFIWMIAGAFVWKSAGGPETAFVQDAISGTPTHCNSDYSDMELMGSILYVTESSDEIYKLAAAGTWSNLANVLGNSSGLHQMVYFRALNRLYIVDDNSAGVGSLESTGTTYTKPTASTQYTLKDLCAGIGVNTGSFISWINATSDKIWIGTISIDGTSGEVYAWDGSSGGGGTYGPNEVYTLNSQGSLACVIKDDVPVIIDVKGRLLQLNGGTFMEIARLPFENEPPIRNDLAQATQRMVHHNGMNLVKGDINILVNSQLWDTNSTIKENVPSGIWEYTPETGLYHKASVGQTKLNGTIVDYGQQKLKFVGALQEIDIPSSITQGTINGRFLVGCDYFTNATTAKSAVFYDDTKDTLQKAGSFITSKIYSENITELWQNIVIRIKRLLTATDKIVVKYRTTDSVPTEATITYVDTTSFTVLASAFTTNPVAGDEVEILNGVGAGRTTHITVVSGTTTLTCTVDETITGATGTAKARFQKWKKIALFSTQNEDFLKFPITEGNSSTWIQFKIWILSTGNNEIADILINNATNQNG